VHNNFQAIFYLFKENIMVGAPPPPSATPTPGEPDGGKDTDDKKEISEEDFNKLPAHEQEKYQWDDEKKKYVTKEEEPKAS
jgi:hypothetical protein